MSPVVITSINLSVFIRFLLCIWSQLLFSLLLANWSVTGLNVAALLATVTMQFRSMLLFILIVALRIFKNSFLYQQNVMSDFVLLFAPWKSVINLTVSFANIAYRFVLSTLGEHHLYFLKLCNGLQLILLCFWFYIFPMPLLKFNCLNDFMFDWNRFTFLNHILHSNLASAESKNRMLEAQIRELTQTQEKYHVRLRESNAKSLR